MSAPGLKITNFHYSNTTFEKTGFIEFPKWVHMNGYKSTIAKNAEEEAVLRSRPPIDGATKPLKPDLVQQPVQVMPKTEVAPLVGSNDEKTILLKIAEEKNIKVDRRWSLKRLRAEMERAQPIT